ncbi:hypothetical protein PENSUB_7788 [Penicillium subrubescens]|uniref:Sulfatase N-terminal domain-containing protein n=1 Tax=Penicillium subrubescens TaxID=1316194 RepID=A0A1Q5TJD5_9EURO|nr:hypothetical protein PENSUB_7788 [Penicillium subrubescens]
MGAKSLPDWASGSLPPGFERWSKGKNATAMKNYYNPVNDPLRITNLDQKLLEPLTQALKDHDVPISHVVLVMMESTRKDVFPFRSGSHLHREILNSYKSQDPDLIHQLNANLSHLTPIAEILTGESGDFPKSTRGMDSSLWKDTTEAGMGGLNINGVLTGSSLSFKSEIVNHCGVWPLPLDFMEEIKSDIYQPCIMQVLELFNKFKENPSASSLRDLRERKWTSIFIQAVTGIYADQNILNDQIGFKKTVYREDIGQKDAKHYHDDMEEINYFGYSEREVYPYMEDAIDDAIKNNERLFLSHFTSTTHHPWGLPKGFQSEQYFSDESLIGKHEDMNSYLNSVRYVDTWLGDLLGLLDKKGISNETLVVFVGDHGQAFQEDSPVTGCYENGHISNFRVPLVFRHPLLPKIQITANTTSLSIIPTILDLLVQTKSLNEKDLGIALDLMNEYEGQSLIRSYKATDDGRQSWNFGIISAGGEMLSVGSAAVPYRLILPLTQDFEFVFSNLDTDPDEENLLRGWSLDDLVSRVKSAHGDKAGQWVVEAEKVGKWWVGESKRLYNHAG